MDDSDSVNTLKNHVRDNWYRDVWLFLLSILVLGSIAFAYTLNKDRIADNRKLIETQAKLSRSREAAITKAMRNVIILSCIQQNANHENTVQQIRELSKRAQKGLPPAARHQARLRTQQTLRLIDALAPYFDDCGKRADQLLRL